MVSRATVCSTSSGMTRLRGGATGMTAPFVPWAYDTAAALTRGMAQGGIQRSALNALLRGEHAHDASTASFAGARRCRALGEPTPPRRPLGGNEKGGHSSLPRLA